MAKKKKVTKISTKKNKFYFFSFINSNFWTDIHYDRWSQYLFKPKPGERHPETNFYRKLYPSIVKDIEVQGPQISLSCFMLRYFMYNDLVERFRKRP